MSGHYQEKQRIKSELNDKKYYVWTAVWKYYTATSYEELPNSSDHQGSKAITLSISNYTQNLSGSH